MLSTHAFAMVWLDFGQKHVKSAVISTIVQGLIM